IFIIHQISKRLRQFLEIHVRQKTKGSEIDAKQRDDLSNQPSRCRENRAVSANDKNTLRSLRHLYGTYIIIISVINVTLGPHADQRVFDVAGQGKPRILLSVWDNQKILHNVSLILSL